MFNCGPFKATVLKLTWSSVYVDSDIQMPEGSPSGQNGGDDSDSDDSIVMPEGDAPPEAKLPTCELDDDPTHSEGC